MKSPDELKRETAELVRDEHARRLDRDARAHRDGAILDAFDRLSGGQPVASDSEPAKRHPPGLKIVP